MSKEEIEKKLEQTEDDEITINLLYEKVDLLEAEIEQLENKIKESGERDKKLIDELEKDIKYYECDLLRLKQIGIDENDEQVITDKILIDKYKKIILIVKGENDGK